MKQILYLLWFFYLTNNLLSQCTTGSSSTISGTDGGSCNIPGGRCFVTRDHTISPTITAGTSTTINFRIQEALVFYSCSNPIPVTIEVYANPGSQLIYTTTCNTPAFNHSTATNCPADTGVKSVTFTPTGNVTSFRFQAFSVFQFGCGTQPLVFDYEFSGSGGGGSGSVSSGTACPSGGSGTNYTWTGCKSTDWFDPCNWDRYAVPTGTSNVTIPNTTNKPLITGATASCFDITINSSVGARLDIASGSGGGLNITKP